MPGLYLISFSVIPSFGVSIYLSIVLANIYWLSSIFQHGWAKSLWEELTRVCVWGGGVLANTRFQYDILRPHFTQVWTRCYNSTENGHLTPSSNTFLNTCDMLAFLLSTSYIVTTEAKLMGGIAAWFIHWWIYWALIGINKIDRVRELTFYWGGGRKRINT